MRRSIRKLSLAVALWRFDVVAALAMVWGTHQGQEMVAMRNLHDTVVRPPIYDEDWGPSHGYWKRGFIHRMQNDRSGSSLGGMQRHRIYAWRLGLHYLGAFHGEYPGQLKAFCGKDQFLDGARIVDFGAAAVPDCAAWQFLGFPPEVVAIPDGTIVVEDFAELEAQLNHTLTKNPHANFLMNSGDEHGYKNGIRQWVGEPTFQERLKMRSLVALTPPTLWSPKAKLRVAVHVRRGDLFSCGYCTNLLPNHLFLDAMAKTQELVGGAEIVVFSSTPFGSGAKGYHEKDWDGLPNTTLRIDGSIVEAWNHIMQCDVFIHGESSFSTLPLSMTDEAKVLGIAVEAAALWNDAEWRAKLLRS